MPFVLISIKYNFKICEYYLWHFLYFFNMFSISSVEFNKILCYTLIAGTLLCFDFTTSLHQQLYFILGAIVFYEKELSFLRETFRKNHVRTTIVTFDDPIDKIMDGYLAVSFGIAETKNDSISKYLVRPKKHTLYKSVDDFGFNFVYMILPDRKDEAVLMIGPFSKVALSTRQTLELSEKHKISPQNQRAFNELLASVPVLQEESHLFLMLNTFCEIIWKGSSFSIEDGSLPGENPASPLQTQTQSQTDNFDELMLEMKVMEKRYAFEN